MRKRRTLPPDFNPEKFLAHDAKKHTPALALKSKLAHLAFQRLIVFEPEFRTTLLDRFAQEHPRTFDPAAGFQEDERVELVRTFLQRALREKKSRLGGTMLDLLIFDFFHGMGERLWQQRQGESKWDSPHEP